MGHDKEKDDSVFDFLYVNRGRLATLLAQLSDEGIITVVKRTSSQSGSNAGGLKVTSLVATGEGSVTSQATEALEQQFDSSGLLAINALTVLQESGLIHKGLPAPLGQIVLITGDVIVFDVSMVKRIWTPATQLMAAQAKEERKKSGKSAGASLNSEHLRLAGGILKEMPDFVQIMIHTEDDVAWGVVGNEDPSFVPEMIGLKHGSLVQGEWHVLGVVDALPDAPIDLPSGDGVNVLANFSEIVQHMRTLIGRPYSAFGVTPLAIFREHPRSGQASEGDSLAIGSDTSE